MAIAKVVDSGGFQAVILPAGLRTAAKSFYVERLGKSLVLTPVDADWSDFFGMLQEFDSANPVERNQPEPSNNLADFS